MPPKFAVGLRACGVAVALILATAYAAERKSPLLGATRDQVIERYGEPTSRIEAGNREVMLFSHERIVLRDGVVIEVEPLPQDPARRAPAPAVPPAEPPSGQDKTTPATPGAPSAPAAAPSAPESPPRASETPAPAQEPKLEIKGVRPAGAKSTAKQPPDAPPQSPTLPSAAPAAAAPTPATNIVTAPAAPAPAAGAAVSTPSPGAPSTAPALDPGANVATPAAPVTSRTTATPEKVTSAEAPEPPKTEDEAKADEKAEAAAAAKKKARARSAARRHLDDEDLDEPPSFFTGREYFIALIVIGGGIAFLYWRHRQRQLELAATAVSRTPFSAPVATSGGAVFTSELLSKLEWKRFEELVAAYYSKTGVVAVRTKTGPASPVNIKISWKGESRPFACVKCIAQPSGLIDAAPLQELFTVLTAEDIRRGYVVSPGKFNVPARDFAEEKHLTLLPGDIFIEKLNALPDAARAEIMQQVTSGDYTTPSCPKCESRMIRSPEDPTMWRCATHPDQQIPVRK